MSVTYNIEEVISKLPPAIEEMEQLKNTTLPQGKDRAVECAKQVGAQQLINDVDALAQTFDGLMDLIGQMIGESGDSIQTATLYGQLAAAKKMNAALNLA